MITTLGSIETGYPYNRKILNEQYLVHETPFLEGTDKECFLLEMGRLDGRAVTEIDVRIVQATLGFQDREAFRRINDSLCTIKGGVKIYILPPNYDFPFPLI